MCDLIYYLKLSFHKILDFIVTYVVYRSVFNFPNFIDSRRFVPLDSLYIAITTLVAKENPKDQTIAIMKLVCQCIIKSNHMADIPPLSREIPQPFYKWERHIIDKYRKLSCNY